MERVIKFRAWIPELEMMLYNVTLYSGSMIGIGIEDFEIALKIKNPNWKLCDDTIYFCDDEHFDPIMSILPGDEWIYIDDDNCKVMQFIGLHDCKSKDIYGFDFIHGKIVRADKTIDIKGYVQYIPELAKYVCKYKSAREWDLKMDVSVFHDIEILGNPFENPEILNQ